MSYYTVQNAQAKLRHDYVTETTDRFFPFKICVDTNEDGALENIRDLIMISQSFHDEKNTIFSE